MWWISLSFAESIDVYLTADELALADEILEQTLGEVEEGEHTSARLLAQNTNGEWVPLEEVLSAPPPVPEKEPIMAPRIGHDQPGESSGSLSGKAVYLSQCHGWIYYSSLGGFSTQRGNLHDTVEDFHNPEGANQFLIQYLENAGAAVFTAKERDLNPNMSIADNDGAGYSEAGAGFETGAAGFKDNAPWVYGENPFDAGTTRRFPANSGSIATWIPEVPEAGYYAVYVSWDSDSANDPNAHYRITHNGGVIDRYYDQRVHGSTWQYVEQLWLEAGVSSLTVELIGDSSSAGTYLSADAVRIGGGFSDVERSGQKSNRPRWEEGAIQYTQFNGAPSSVYDPYGDGWNGSDPPARSRWAAWEHPTGEDAIYLSWHSNAGGGTGTDTFYYNSGAVAGSADLAQFVQDELIDTIRGLHDSSWADRGVKSANFAEVNSNHNNEMPSILVELGFHDSEYDTQFLLDPIFRRDASRAMARGVIKYFASRDGYTPVFQPEPPLAFSALPTASGVQLSWEDGEIGAPYGDAPTSYRVYQSLDGRAWDNGVDVAETHVILPVSAGETRYYRVAALNAGGSSFSSETLSYQQPLGLETPVLIVSAYDRLQTSSLFWASVGSVGSVKRMDLRRINAFDSIIETASAISNNDYPFASISDEALANTDLSDFSVIVWIAGEESTADSTFTLEDQTILRDFVSRGGKLIVSGSEIFWDLDYRGSESDKAFAQEILGALMDSDDAESYVAEGVGALSGLRMNFSFDEGASYNVEWPDVLNSNQAVVAQYTTGGIAGIYNGTAFVFGFPLETIIGEETRAELFGVLLGTLLTEFEDVPEPSTEPDTAEPSTEVSVEPSEEDEDTDNDSGVSKEEQGCSCRKNQSDQAWSFLPIVFLFSFWRRHERE